MRQLAGALVGIIVLGCGDERLAGAPVAEGQGGGGGGGGGPDALYPPGEPVPLRVSEWLVASVSAQNDPVRAAIADGTFAMPSAGSYLGLDWQSVAPGPNGELVTSFFDLVYAAARVSSPAGRGVFARGDGVFTFYVDNDAPQPGDFYFSRKLRVPLAVAPGEHVVVVRADGHPQRPPEVELWSSDAELVINDGDVTAPSPVAGSAAELPLGVAVLNLTMRSLDGLRASVVPSDALAASSVSQPPLAPHAVTQLAFSLRPRVPWPEAGTTVRARLRVEGPSLVWAYEREIELATVAPSARRRVTRRSQIDGSVQYYALMPPSAPPPDDGYGLVLSLHGAGVEATGQAEAYSPKSWAFLAAATNRRPFGFDWEEWGRLDALETLAHALGEGPINPTRAHLTGHSMGGHGTWHVGVHHGHRFAVVAPSAGWISFAEYTGPPHPTGPLGRARAHSQTLDFIENLAPRTVYIIHGAADDNVPVSHARKMHQTLQGIVAPDELTYYEDPKGRHWWDNDPNEEGADCVDWEPMMAVAEKRAVDPVPLSFFWVTPAPWVSARHSFVTLLACASPMQNCSVGAKLEKNMASGDRVVVTTENVRALELDGAALAQKGVSEIVLDGAASAVEAAPMRFGPEGGKRPDVYGPLNQIFHRPFCFVWDDAGSPMYAEHAALLTSWWSLVGNGQACGVPLSALGPSLRAEKNLVYLGVARDKIPELAGAPIAWDAGGVTVGDKRFDGAMVVFVYPSSAGDRLVAAISAPEGKERLVFNVVPFTSRSGRPDWWVLDATGTLATGFFDAEWKLAPAFSTGL
jgi:poly(3-hydroxybutyrate) depolymerase